MANRVTATEVKQIIDVDSNILETDLTVHINAANRIITKVVVSSVMSTADLKECERWLAAHFIAMGRDPISNIEKAATVGETKGHRLDLGLNNTRFGQMAMAIDTSGALVALSKGSKKASFVCLNPC